MTRLSVPKSGALVLSQAVPATHVTARLTRSRLYPGVTSSRSRVNTVLGRWSALPNLNPQCPNLRLVLKTSLARRPVDGLPPQEGTTIPGPQVHSIAREVQ